MNIPSLFFSGGRSRPVPTPPQYPVVLPTSHESPRGTVLFSYMTECLTYHDDDVRLKGHSNLWECRTIVRIFNDLGFDVEAIRWDDRTFTPRKDYQVIFDISSNLPRLSAHMEQKHLLLLHRTGSDAFFQNAAEISRVKSMEARRNANYCPKRQVPFPDLERLALEKASSATLLGNEYILQTYPAELKQKIRLIPVSGSELCKTEKKECYVPSERNILCFCGNGGAHKGIDLLLEVFGAHPEWTLHIVGDVIKEPDFKRAYLKELTSTTNIHYHGFLYPSDPEFQTILSSCFAFILPSCSEGTSAAAVTCMQLGLYPLISRETGVTLPKDCGRYLETCSIEEIETLVLEILQYPATQLEKEISTVQRFAMDAFSRKAFHSAMFKAIEDATKSIPMSRTKETAPCAS